MNNVPLNSEFDSEFVKTRRVQRKIVNVPWPHAGSETGKHVNESSFRLKNS